MIYYDFRQCLTQQQYANTMNWTFGNKAPSNSRILSTVGTISISLVLETKIDKKYRCHGNDDFFFNDIEMYNVCVQNQTLKQEVASSLQNFIVIIGVSLINFVELDRKLL